MTAKWILTILALATLLPVAAAAEEFEYDRSFDFGGLRTFAWTDGTPARRPAADQRIVDTLTAELVGRGYRKVETSPDFHVARHILVDQHTLKELSEPDTWAFLTGVASINAYDVGAGTLVLDIHDSRTSRVVWRGMVTVKVSGPIGKVEKRVGKKIRTLLANFPPG